MAIDVEDVCTHEQLDEYVLGLLTEKVHLLPPQWVGDSSIVRRQGLTDVLDALRNRVPPVHEADIADPSELRQCVVHYAAMRLYDGAMTSGAEAEVFHAKMKAEEKRYGDRLAALRPTIAAGDAVAPGLSFGVGRR
jgi:hypothetical protein